jgi:hypothetical protein
MKIDETIDRLIELSEATRKKYNSVLHRDDPIPPWSPESELATIADAEEAEVERILYALDEIDYDFLMALDNYSWRYSTIPELVKRFQETRFWNRSNPNQKRTHPGALLLGTHLANAKNKLVRQGTTVEDLYSRYAEPQLAMR